MVDVTNTPLPSYFSRLNKVWRRLGCAIFRDIFIKVSHRISAVLCLNLARHRLHSINSTEHRSTLLSVAQLYRASLNSTECHVTLPSVASLPFLHPTPRCLINRRSLSLWPALNRDSRSVIVLRSIKWQEKWKVKMRRKMRVERK